MSVYTNNNDIEAGFNNEMSQYIQNADANTRLGFIRKVYTLLTIQLVITFGLILMFMNVPFLYEFYLKHFNMIFIVSLVLMIVFAVGIACCYGFINKVPYNYIALFGYTIILSIFITSSCLFLETKVVLAAMAIAIGITIIATLYACFTKTDFTPWGMMFTCSLFSLIFSGLLMFWFNNFFYCLYCFMGVVVFIGYIIYDTQLIVGGNHKFQYGVDDYVLAALNLYLDIINLFLYILSLLSNDRN